VPVVLKCFLVGIGKQKKIQCDFGTFIWVTRKNEGKLEICVFSSVNSIFFSAANFFFENFRN